MTEEQLQEYLSKVEEAKSKLNNLRYTIHNELQKRNDKAREVHAEDLDSGASTVTEKKEPVLDAGGIVTA